MHSSLVFGLTLALCVVSAARTRADDDRVADLMEKTHEGRKSPYKAALRAAENNPPDWAALNAAGPGLVAMSQALAAAKDKDVRDSADGYVDAVKELGLRVRNRDRAGARAALTKLTASCADCHFKGGPGGKLDD